MPEYLTPGVYVEETSFRSRSIEGVPTSTFGMAGRTQYGPLPYSLPGLGPNGTAAGPKPEQVPRLRSWAGPQRLLEPHLLVGSVVGDDVHDDPDAQRVRKLATGHSNDFPGDPSASCLSRAPAGELRRRQCDCVHIGKSGNERHWVEAPGSKMLLCRSCGQQHEGKNRSEDER